MWLQTKMRRNQCPLGLATLDHEDAALSKAIDWIKNHKPLTAIVAAIVIIPGLALAWWLGSPLFIDKTVDEDFPALMNAVVPDGMEMVEANATMEAVMDAENMVEEEMMEAMGAMLAPDAVRLVGSATATASTEEAAARRSTTLGLMGSYCASRTSTSSTVLISECCSLRTPIQWVEGTSTPPTSRTLNLAN